MGSRNPIETILIRPAEKEDVFPCFQIETACFEPSEAASELKIKKRLSLYPEGFLVAIKNGSVEGFINSGSTDSPDLSCEELKEMKGHDPEGSNIVVFSLAVRPESQGKGISRLIFDEFRKRAKTMGKQAILLLCKEELILFYKNYGFEDLGRSASVHGGFLWHHMRYSL